MKKRKKILRFKPKENHSPICRLCGFYEMVHRPRFVMHGGCAEWVPSDNLHYLEWCLAKKGEEIC